MQLSDGETKYTKQFINPVGLRKKTNADTTPIKERQIQEQFDSPRAYKHGLDLNSHSTDRDTILTELRRHKDLYQQNDELIEGIIKVKNSNEFKKEFPITVQHISPIVKMYKKEDHNKITAPGYSRNGYGRAYFS